MPKSPFPTDFLGVDLEYDGVWNPLGTDLDQEGVSVAHGARSEGGSADVSSVEFRVKNGDGKYSPRNPNSVLDGKIGRNTPARATAALGAPWLNFEQDDAAWATTPDTAALSITGDIDLRWHGRRDSWASNADLISKYVTSGNQRSYLWRFEADGTLTLFWSADGTALLEARSTAPIPPWAGEIALRVTMDVNNGASGRTIRFYYADELGTDWIQLGPDVVQAGTTSIFNSTAPTTIGKNSSSIAGVPATRVYGWSIRDGIGGTTVSSRNIADLAVTGAASFADTQGNTWTPTNATVTNQHTLAVAEVAEWPIEWGRKGAPSVFTNIEASGVTRRLGQGAQPIDSPIYRAITTATNPNIKAYWPMEEGEDADAFAPAIRGTRAGWVGDPELGSYTGFGGSKPLPVLRQTRVRFRVPAYADTDQVQARFLFHKPSSGWTAAQTIAEVHMQSFGLESVTLLTGATPGYLRFLGRDSDGVQLFDSGTTDWDVENRDIRVSIELTQSGADTDWRVSVDGTFGFGLELTGTLTGTGFGRCTSVLVNPNRNDVDYAIGHLTVESSTSSVHDVPPAILNGYQDESSQDRILRICTEHDIPLYGRGRASTPVAMGPQPMGTFLDVVGDTANADGGLLHDNPVALGLRIRRLHSMGSQPPVTIPYTDNLVIPFEPSDDDALTRNRVTVDTPRGARAAAEASSGPLSTLPPPDGVGLYEEGLTLNLNTDDMVQRHADWAVHVGTWDEGRYPTLGVDLAHPDLLADPILTRKLLALTPGDRLLITDPPSWLPPTSVDVLVMGIQIDVTPLHVRLTWTCVPARPYHVGYWNHPEHRWSADGTVLASSVPASGSALVLDGVSPGRASTPDAAALDIVGDIDLRVYVAMDDWTPAATSALLTKSTTSGNQISWRFNVLTTGALRLVWSADGSTTLTADSTATVAAADGTALWVRATLDVDNGAAGRSVRFYTSTDGVTWTQLGSTVTTAGVTSIFSGSAPVVVGSRDVGTLDRLAGRVSAVEIRSGIAGTVVANPEFGAQPAGTSSFADGTGKTWTVTAPALIASVASTLFPDTLPLTVPAGLSWTHADGDYDITVGGELMTVTNVIGTAMTVTRSVNGVNKAHSAGAAVALAEPSFYPR